MDLDSFIGANYRMDRPKNAKKPSKEEFMAMAIVSFKNYGWGRFVDNKSFMYFIEQEYSKIEKMTETDYVEYLDANQAKLLLSLQTYVAKQEEVKQLLLKNKKVSIFKKILNIFKGKNKK